MNKHTPGPSLQQIANEIYKNGMSCNCDLDKWEPERNTGHSWVCRIHKAVINNSSEAIAARAALSKASQQEGQG